MWWVEARDAAEQGTVPRTPHTQKIPGPNVSSAKTWTLHLKALVHETHRLLQLFFILFLYTEITINVFHANTSHLNQSFANNFLALT